ncbi:uncharacterized protein LOC116289258 [Actinia tenebrosa]|uniref:Uncharacterized protein LOC116289258 n=1 Tax=Actinia tenebrosa TaxID=6105 RepID=A0A6P8H6J3_ACTTE|nr:uncharacterized protein LOC116289258 [Actinia tenebrosa]
MDLWEPLRDMLDRKFLTWVVILILGRLFFLILYTVWLCDCFFREFKMEIPCKDFTLYPEPKIMSAVWLVIVSITSVCLINFARQWHETSPLRSIFDNHLYRKKYFYELCFINILVIIYDLITIFAREFQVRTTVLYCAYILEHITSTALMLTLNFIPEFVQNVPQYNPKYCVYKITLLLYSIENYVLHALGTVVAAYRLVSVPTCSNTPENQNNTDCYDVLAVIMLFLLVSVLAIRLKVGEFFLAKFFEEDVNVLDPPSRKLRSD